MSRAQSRRVKVLASKGLLGDVVLLHTASGSSSVKWGLPQYLSPRVLIKKPILEVGRDRLLIKRKLLGSLSLGEYRGLQL